MQSLGLYSTVQDIENTVIKANNGAPIRIKDIATVTQGPKIRLGQIGRATHRPDGTIVDNPDTVEGIVLLQKGDDSDPVLQGIHEEVKKLNGDKDHPAFFLPGVKIVPFLDRSDLVKFTVDTVEHNLTEGHDPCLDHPVSLSRKRPRRDHCRAHHSLRAAVCFHLPRSEPYSGQPALAGRTGLRHGRRRLAW